MVAAQVFALCRRGRGVLGHRLLRDQRILHSAFGISGHRRRDSFPLSRYLAARCTRILPLYYLALAFAVVVEWLIAGARPPVLVQRNQWQRTLRPDLHRAEPVPDLWLICAVVEHHQRDVLLPVLTVPLVCFSLKRGIRAVKLGMIVCLAVAVPMDLLYFGWIRSRFVARRGFALRTGNILVLGAFVAEYRDALRSSPLAKSVVPFLAVALGGCRRDVVFSARPSPGGVCGARDRLHRDVGSHCGGRRVVSRAGTTVVDRLRLVRMLGLASYPTYLFHGPLLLLVGSAILRWKLISDWRLTWLILVSVGISTGIALGYLAERPIMTWRAAFLSRFRSPRTPPSRGDVKVPVLSIQQ